ncbi:MAG: HNH endonuclease signature motif containing protein, partial [Bdellovibrionia bacterium]
QYVAAASSELKFFLSKPMLMSRQQSEVKMNEQNLNKYSDDGLLLSLGGLLDQERKTDRLILLHLLEVSERRLYAKRGFDSLFAMLVGFFKLSEGSANRRLQAMRILKDVPLAQNSLLTGEVNLTTLSMSQIQVRQEEKLTGEKMSLERKAAIVESIKNKTQAEAAIELFKQLPATATYPRNEERRISENETRLSHNFPDRVLNKLKRLREIWSHVNPGMDYVEIIERCADEILKRVDPSLERATPGLKEEMPHRLAAPAKHRVTKHTKASPVARPSEARPERPTYYSKETKRKIYSQAGACCEFVDPKTDRRCRSRFLLEIDHKIPIWAGGGSESENLQLLCSTHNQLKYAIETKRTTLSDRVTPYRIESEFSRTA